ncbi:cytochrome c [Alphaproteobacteria bacterium LSUCC0719]
MTKSHILTIVGTVASLGLVYHLASPVEQATASVTLKPNEQVVVALGEQVYAQNCASCHGVALEGQANWQQRDADGYLPAPPHDETGHTWHHPDTYLFLMTKYGIEKMIGKTYPNNMPAYEDELSDDEIIAVLSFIKSTWPNTVKRQHDQINARANAQSKES